MITYETLLDEALDEGLVVKEKPLQGNDGRIKGDRIAIRYDLTTVKKKCVLAEEMGHYETTVGDILSQDELSNIKQERLARIWAYEKLLPLDKIYEAASKGYTTTWAMADYLDVDEEFLKHCLVHYGILDISL